MFIILDLSSYVTKLYLCVRLIAFSCHKSIVEGALGGILEGAHYIAFACLMMARTIEFKYR